MTVQSVEGLINPMDLQSGEGLKDGGTISVLLNPQAHQNGLTALAGGGATGATRLRPGLNEISTAATTGDSALLPPALAGLTVTVVNNGAQTVDVWPSGTDVLVPLAGSTATDSAVLANAIVTFYCYKPGFWKASV